MADHENGHRGALGSAAWAVGGAVAGLLLGLGLRSLGHEPASAMHDMAAMPAEHHAEPGHDGHGHDAGDSPDKAKAHTGHDMQDAPVKEPTATPDPGTGLLLDLGNAVCPVMGGEPDGTTFSEWRGLRVSHCCAGCTKDFLADPEGTLDEAGIEWREALEAADGIRAATGEEQARLIDEADSRWKVLRRPGKEESE